MDTKGLIENQNKGIKKASLIMDEISDMRKRLTDVFKPDELEEVEMSKD